MTIARSIVAAAALGAASGAIAYDEPPFSVIGRHETFEVRRYEPYLVAETAVQGDFEGARNAAFRRLFDYISGNNRSGESIAMTVPVTSSAGGAGEKIDMTAPVTTTAGREADGYVMRFVVPSRYTLETVPRPLDTRVSVRQLDEQIVAVRTYSGRSNETNYRENEAILLAELARAGYSPTGRPLFAVYNSPFTPWFLRRNEVIVPVAPVRSPG